MVTLTRVGDFKLTWGESLRWDDRRRRLYFVDCATHTLHWLEQAEPPLYTMKLPSMAVLVETTAGGAVHPQVPALTPVVGVCTAPRGT